MQFRHAVADDDNEIGGFDARFQLRIGRDAEFAGIARMAIVEEHGAAKDGRDRQREALGKAAHVVDRLRRPTATAENDDRRFCSREKRLQFGNLLLTGKSLDALDARRVVDRRLLRQHVFWQGNDDRPRPALHRNVKGARDDFRNARGIVDLDRPFRRRAE